MELYADNLLHEGMHKAISGAYLAATSELNVETIPTLSPKRTRAFISQRPGVFNLSGSIMASDNAGQMDVHLDDGVNGVVLASTLWENQINPANIGKTWNEFGYVLLDHANQAKLPSHDGSRPAVANNQMFDKLDWQFVSMRGRAAAKDCIDFIATILREAEKFQELIANTVKTSLSVTTQGHDDGRISTRISGYIRVDKYIIRIGTGFEYGIFANDTSLDPDGEFLVQTIHSATERMKAYLRGTAVQKTIGEFIDKGHQNPANYIRLCLVEYIQKVDRELRMHSRAAFTATGSVVLSELMEAAHDNVSVVIQSLNLSSYENVNRLQLEHLETILQTILRTEITAAIGTLHANCMIRHCEARQFLVGEIQKNIAAL